MSVSAISQALVSKAGFAPDGAVLVYDPAVEHVGQLLAGLDQSCSAVPAGAADIHQLLTGLLQAARSIRFTPLGTVPRAAYSLKTFS